MMLKMCNLIFYNVCLDERIALIYSHDIFPVSHLAKLISSLIVCRSNTKTHKRGLDVLSISPFLVIDDNPIKAS
jgi:hypothetical protein